MKKYVVLISGVGELNTHQDTIESAIKLVGLNVDDFVTVGLGTSTQLCVSAEVYTEKKNDLALGMVKSHLTTIKQVR